MNTSNGETPILKAFLFGNPEFWLNDKILSLPPTRKSVSLLAYLLLHPKNPHSRETLAALFWGEVPDKRAKGSLRTALSALRTKIKIELFITDRETVQLNPGIPIWVDVRQFELNSRSVSKGNPEGLQEAIALYRGELLTGFYDDWILRERDHYRRLYLDFLLRMTQLMRSQSQYERAIGYAEQVLQDDPANERAHQHLIFCHLANGDRGAAVRQYEDCRCILQQELGVEPSPETKALYQWLRHTPADANEARITNLPIPLTSFIGRTREMARVKYMLAQARLITLTGPGGSGKTRLAIQVASDLVDSFRDGVWWVDFAPLIDETLVPQTIAKAVGVQEVRNIPFIKTLVNYLRNRNMLLVLDNCEHLVGSISRLAIELLSTCPELKILATSRETLNVPGETILRVPSLMFPISRGGLPGENLADYESVSLLVERARAIKTDFNLNQDNLSSVAQICRRLEGMPLAIELAAARLKVLSIQQIAARLQDQLSFLTTGSLTTLPRHQTLRGVIDWSFDLLTEQEQGFLCCLSVFVGGWTLEAAKAVCGEAASTQEVIDLMTSLVDKSLVELADVRGGEARYRMLETIRQYGQERLRQAGQLEAVQHRHARFFVHLAEKAEPQLRDSGMRIWFERLESEHDNFRKALEWSLAHESPAFCFRYAGALGQFWQRGYLQEGLTFLERLLAYGEEVPAELRVKAMLPASWLARSLGNYEKATFLHEESLQLLRAAGDEVGMADALIQGGLLSVYKDNPQCAVACFTESLILSERANYRWGRARALVNLAHSALFNLEWNRQARMRGEESLQLFEEMGDATEQAHALIILGPGSHYEGDDQRGRRLIEKAIAITRRSGDRRQLAWATIALSGMILWQGKRDEALETAKQALGLAVELGEKSLMVFVSSILAVLAKDRGRMIQGLHLLGSAIAWGESFGYRLTPFQWDIIKGDIDALRATLGEAAFNRALEEGEKKSIKKALQDALQD